MNYYKIKNLRTGNVCVTTGNTFGDACKKLGWNCLQCQCLALNNGVNG